MLESGLVGLSSVLVSEIRWGGLKLRHDLSVFPKLIRSSGCDALPCNNRMGPRGKSADLDYVGMILFLGQRFSHGEAARSFLLERFCLEHVNVYIYWQKNFTNSAQKPSTKCETGFDKQSTQKCVFSSSHHEYLLFIYRYHYSIHTVSLKSSPNKTIRLTQDYRTEIVTFRRLDYNI